MKKTLIVLFFIGMFFQSYNAQAVVVLKGDFLDIDYMNNIFKYLGNVDLESSKLKLTSHSLIYQKNNKTYQAKGGVNLFLKKSNFNIYSELLSKEGSLISITGNRTDEENRVKSEDKKNERIIYSKSLNIIDNNRKDSTQIINFNGPVFIEDKDSTIETENKVVYNMKTKKTQFNGISTITDKEEQNKIQSKDIVLLDKSSLLVFSQPLDIIDSKNHYLSAKKGIYNIKTKEVNLSDDVNFIGDVAKIKSEKLTTDIKGKDKFYIFSKKIRIKYQNLSGTSQFVRHNPKSSYIELRNNVFFKSESGFTIQCHVMDIDEKAKKSYLYKDVIIKQDGKVVKGDIGIYNEKTNVFTLKGNVNYKSNGSEYTAQTILINEKTSSFRLVGNIQGVSSLNKMKGIKVENETK